MKEVKVKDKNRRSCCERYVREYMLGILTLDYIVKKMKVNPQLKAFIERKIKKTRERLVNVPVELWSIGDYADCVAYILDVNTKYAHIAQYLNAIHKGKIKGEKCTPDGVFRGHKVRFDYNDDSCILIADFVDDGVVIKSVKYSVITINIH